MSKDKMGEVAAIIDGPLWAKRGKSGGGAHEWSGLDARTRSGGVLRMSSTDEGEPIDVFTFDDPGHMVCCTTASFGDSVPPKAIAAYVKAMLDT